ncbi:hypothetical protein ATANTOWER_026389 [Ataeniobius toweri]|uniref:Uncharacterized protein n=1 Tax=Ataeniobius toweri TaxID=208326 RepID=A0ABU7BB88_9TELE|nr:hypothetical protein [Ataeniobius toweri]
MKSKEHTRQGPCLSWSLNKNSTWRTHHPVSSNHSSLGTPTNGRSALLLGQSSSRASLLKTICMEDTALLLSFDLLHPFSTIGEPYQGLHHHQDRIPGGKTYLIIIIRCLFKLISSSAFTSSSGVRAPKK